MGKVVECRTRDPEVPGSNPGVAKKENLSQVQSEQYHHQSLCTRVKYLKLSEVKTRSRRGSVVECRTRDPDSPGYKPRCGQKRKSLTDPIRTIPPPIPLHHRVKYLKLSMGENQKLPWLSGRVQD